MLRCTSEGGRIQEHKDQSVRHDACQALERLVPDAEELVALQAISKARYGPTESKAQSLATLAKEAEGKSCFAIAALAELCEEQDEELLQEMLRLLSCSNPRYDERLALAVHACTQHIDAQVRLWALQALSRIVPVEDHKATTAVIGFLADADERVRREALKITGRRAMRNSANLSVVCGLLKHSHTAVRAAALQALPLVAAPGDLEASSAARRLSQDPDASVRHAALHSLAQLAPESCENLALVIESAQRIISLSGGKPIWTGPAIQPIAGTTHGMVRRPCSSGLCLPQLSASASLGAMPKQSKLALAKVLIPKRTFLLP
mmetsp:Transcript_58042/g.125462  ORF Transcript_58042/g.125462 Transcript_58042/m.125462 type:complete len:321 (+) Transcript_58042:54-1016(+)